MKHEINEELYSFAISRIRDEARITKVSWPWTKEALEKAGLPVIQKLCGEEI